MKERDITELLVDLPAADGKRHFRPFVVLPTRTLQAHEEDAGAGYLVWLASAESPEKARRDVSFKWFRQCLPEQTLESWENLPHEDYALPGGEIATIYEAVSERAETKRSELLIGRIADNLYLWGVHNPR